LSWLRRLVDRRANSWIRSTAADIAAHGKVNLIVVGMRRFGQQRSGRHNLTRLAIAALDDLEIYPRFLDASADRIVG